MPARWLPSFVTLVALALSLIWTEAADARLERGLSFAGGGVFGSINFDDVLSYDNSFFPVAAQPTYRGGSLGGLFSRGDLIGGFAAGLLGSGVIGLLFGHGVVGELGGVASVLGLMFQLALIAMLARLIWTWWHDAKAVARADLSPRQLADAYRRPRNEVLQNMDPSADADDALGETVSEVLSKTERPHS
jgi:hypothetical protein